MPLIDASQTYQMTNVGDHINATDVYNTNPNLLDNPWFGTNEVINQRDATSGSPSNAYFIDRWKLSGSYSLSTSGLTITCNAGSGPAQIFSRALTIGKVYTYSVMYGDLSVVSVTFSPLANTENVYAFGDGLLLEIDTRPSFPTHRCIIYKNGSQWTNTFRAAKLELGTVSTLANDVPPDYGEELLKCLRYQWVVTAENTYGVIGQATMTTQNTQGMMVVKLPVPMRAIPTLSHSGSFKSVGGNGTSIQVGAVTSFAISTNASNKNFVCVDVTGTNMGNTGTSVVIGADSDATAKLIFDANL